MLIRSDCLIYTITLYIKADQKRSSELLDEKDTIETL